MPDEPLSKFYKANRTAEPGGQSSRAMNWTRARALSYHIAIYRNEWGRAFPLDLVPGWLLAEQSAKHGLQSALLLEDDACCSSKARRKALLKAQWKAQTSLVTRLLRF